MFSALIAIAWLYQPWSGYQPAAQFDEAVEDGRTVLRLRRIGAEHGGCIRTTPAEPCRAGDVAHVTFECRGSGRAFATVARYGVRGGFNQSAPYERFGLSATWTPHEFVFPIADGTAGKTGSCDLQIGAEKGSEVSFANVRFTVERRSFDDFESDGPHPGGAEVVVGNIAPGLLEPTRMGVIRTSEPRVIEFPKNRFALPTCGGNPRLESSVRLYSFGRDRRRDAALDMRFGAEDGDGFTLRIDHAAQRETLDCLLADRIGGKTAVRGRLQVPYGALPADFILSAARDGEVRLEVKSLSDSSASVAKTDSSFFRGRDGEIGTRMLFTPKAGEGELVFDEYAVGRASPDRRLPPVVHDLEKLPEFDPVKAGWPLVFGDEFEGTSLDTGKWERVYAQSERPDLAYVRDGRLHLLCDWDAKREKLETIMLWSREDWTYGYFEAKVRFTVNSGWWAAFWLCARSDANPFKDGFEVDIFEDYYTRCDKPDGEHKPILDHNIHLYGSACLKSWNYRSEVPGSLDDFHVIGCRWTPFEISYYLDGKLIASEANHSPHRSVTFDAVSHAAGFSPLRAILSGQIMTKAWGCRDTTGFVFPEEYLVDYVRVYAYPDPGGPKVGLRMEGAEKGVFSRPGDTLRFEATADRAADGAKIKAVYLFDSGYLLDYRTEPPYAFEVPLTDDHYGTTRYMRPGRSGKVVPLRNTTLHAFAAFALDEKGRYGHSATIDRLLGDPDHARPFGETAQTIPGVIRLGRFDEGGQGVAYGDNGEGNSSSATFRTNEWVDAASEAVIGGVYSGEWLTYTVDIAEEGEYLAQFRYGTPVIGCAKLHLFVDGMKAGTLDCPSRGAKSWGSVTPGDWTAVRLPKGRHRLTLLCEERFNMYTLEFRKSENQKGQ